MSALVAASPTSAFRREPLGSGSRYPANSPLETLTDQDPPFLIPTEPEVPFGSGAAATADASVAVIPEMSVACGAIVAPKGSGEVKEKGFCTAATSGEEGVEPRTDFLSTAEELIKSEVAKLGSASKQSSAAQLTSLVTTASQNGEVVAETNMVANRSAVKLAINPSPGKEYGPENGPKDGPGNGPVATEMVRIGSTAKIQISSPTVKIEEGGSQTKKIDEIDRATVAPSNVDVVIEEAVLKVDKASNGETPLNGVSNVVQQAGDGSQETSPHGPNTIAPATGRWAVGYDEAVQLELTEKGPGAVRPLAVTTAFQDTVARYPDSLALAVKINGAWRSWTFRMYYADVWRAAKGFIQLGLEPYHGVGIIGFNSPEWFISNFAAIFAGGLSTGIYTTNSAEACRYVAHNARCDVIVVEDDAQLQKILAVREQLPYLRAIVQYRGEPKQAHPGVYSWADLMALGGRAEDELLLGRIAQQAVNKCCTLIYTSGTTGNPKGVMLSHDNLTWTARMSTQSLGFKIGSESLVSFLPLSHVAAQMLDMYIPLIHAAAVYFAQPDALKGSLVETMREVRPTAFLGVPRVWEKMQEKLEAAASKAGWMRRSVLSWARSLGLQGNLSRMIGGGVPWGWRVANRLVFRKVRAALGLDRTKICMTAAAPITRETLEYFASLDIPIMEIFGMSETSGPHTVSSMRRWRLGSVGPAMVGASIAIAGATRPDEEGEICLKGRNIFMGYLAEMEKTTETVDAEGFLHSGDVGRVDQNGFLFITGRIKELIITAGGENVAPVPIEDSLRELLPCVSNCMLVGDRRKFLSILITLKTEVDPDTSAPLDALKQSALDWCRAHGSSVTTVTELLARPDDPVMHAIQAGVNRTNQRAVSRAQHIQKFTVLPHDFSVVGGELGPTLKLRRPIVAKMYESTIEAFYAE